MRGDLRTALRSLVYPTLALLFVVAVLPGRLGLAIRIYALLLCGVALLLVLSALRRAYPRATPLRPASRPPGRRPRPGSLARLEHVAALGVAGSFDLHHRLRPRLRTIAQGLLSTRRRIALDTQPDAARAVLGDETYALVRRDRPPPEDRRARGLPLPELERVTRSLEGI